jgi:predicted MFS family arabinose efflux permease
LNAPPTPAGRESIARRADSTPISGDAAIADTAAPLYGRDFWLVFGANFGLNLSASLFVMLPALVMRLGGGAAQIGAIIAVGSLAALAVRPLNGVGIDRFGCRWLGLRLLLLDALATMAYLPLGSLGWPIYAVRAIHGAIDGTARVALFAMVYELLPAGRRGQAMATFTLCSMIPAALGPAMGEEIIAYLGFSWFFIAAAALCLISAAIVSRMRSGSAAAGPDPRQSAPSGGFAALLRDRALLPLWTVTLLWSIALAARIFVIPFAYQEGIARVGWYFMLYCGVAVVLRVFGAGLIDRVGLERIVAPSLVLTAVGLGFLAFTGRFGMLAMAALAGGVGHGYFYPAMVAQVIGHTRAEQMGRSSAIFNSLMDFGAMVGPYGLGLMANASGYGPMFWAAAALALWAAGYYCVGLRRKNTAR